MLTEFLDFVSDNTLQRLPQRQPLLRSTKLSKNRLRRRGLHLDRQSIRQTPRPLDCAKRGREHEHFCNMAEIAERLWVPWKGSFPLQ